MRGALGMALVLAACLSLTGATPGREAERSGDLWVEVLDADGRPAESASGFEVRQGGESLATRDLGPVGDRWRVVLLFDQMLTEPLAFHNATLLLAERAAELTALGTVEILLAGSDFRTALPATRDADAVEQALAWMRLRDTSEDRQVDLRRSVLASLGVEGESAAAEVSIDPAMAAETVRAAVEEEAVVLRRHRERLLSWAVEEVGPGPKALFLIGGGFDDDPAAYYRSRLAGTPLASALDGLASAPVDPSVAEVGQVLSAYGWTTLPLVPATTSDLLLERTDDSPEPQEGQDEVDVVMRDGRLVDRTTVGFDPVDLLRRRRERAEEVAEAAPALLSPLAPLTVLAEATGGELVTTKLQFNDLLERLPLRRRLTYSGSGPVPLGLSALAVESGGAATRAARWTAGATPEVVAALRARSYLEEGDDEGELPVAAAVQTSGEGGPARLTIQIAAEPSVDLAPPTGAARITVAAAVEEGGTRVVHELARPVPPEEGSRDERTLSLDLPLVPDDDSPLVVLVEFLETGRWGAAYASNLGSAGVPGVAADLAGALLPSPRVLHLLAPRAAFAVGRTLLETVVSERAVSRVDFYLDGEREAVRREAPFAATLDLGPLPQPRRVEAVAFDEAGGELGRDYLILNEGSGIFGVRIVSPDPGAAGGGESLRSGPIDVEAEVEPRRGEGIDRVEFFWKETLVATRFAPPWRHRVLIPAAEPRGFIRVVAYLDDGASSEDVVFVNSPGESDRVQVNLMELYVVVTDRRGRPVRDLTEADFRVREAGVAQEIATFSDAGDLPLTVGLAIDSSASMFVKLPQVQLAAADFVRGLSTRRDRAFVVGFGNEPSLARNTTSDLTQVIRSLGGLQPDGRTAIWKAIVYSLVQLQGVPGKKALIVYSDGADEDPDFSYRTCLRFARKVGVPVYVILSNNEIVRTQGRGLNVRSFLNRLESLTDTVGGRVFFARVGDDLERVYAEIEEELRSQYLVGYYSTDSGGRQWREVDVDVERSGLKARTIAGFFR